MPLRFIYLERERGREGKNEWGRGTERERDRERERERERIPSRIHAPCHNCETMT